MQIASAVHQNRAAGAFARPVQKSPLVDVHAVQSDPVALAQAAVDRHARVRRAARGWVNQLARLFGA